VLQKLDLSLPCELHFFTYSMFISSSYFFLAYDIGNHTGKFLHIMMRVLISSFFCVLNLCPSHAGHILSKLPATHQRLSELSTQHTMLLWTWNIMDFVNNKEETQLDATITVRIWRNSTSRPPAGHILRSLYHKLYRTV
jgi:hypothetical protein